MDKPTSATSFLGLFPCELKNWMIVKQKRAGSFVHSYAARLALWQYYTSKMKVFFRWYNCLVAPLTNPPVTYEGNLLQCFQCSVVTLTGGTQSKTLALVLSVGSDVSFYVRCCCCC